MIIIVKNLKYVFFRLLLREWKLSLFIYDYIISDMRLGTVRSVCDIDG